ncbi:MAG TPA: hypothetical protein PLW48_03385 [Alphaproteobacteria bacterium]|nr:hypothetical protein [Rhodospirillaceae bacterium]HRJ66153.1 hypothetical protein [Alphaproteobacteria bacterium]
MRRWANILRQSFQRGGRKPAQSTPASFAPPEEATVAPEAQSEQNIFTDFAATTLPLLQALKNLPPDAQGLEFFLRADIVEPGQYPDRPDIEPRIDIWLFHTREGKPAGRLHEAPSSHLITIESKHSTPERQDFSQLLALSETPVLRLSFRPQAEAPAARLSHHTYIERYEKPQAGKKYSVYCGDHGMVIEKTPDTPVTHSSDFRAVIGAWLRTHAPARIAAVEGLLYPPRDITLPQSVTIRKRSQKP